MKPPTDPNFVPDQASIDLARRMEEENQRLFNQRGLGTSSLTPPNTNNIGGGMQGRITFPPNMYNPYTPRSNPINITNPFTRPNQTIGFQPFPTPAPPSTAQTTIPNYSLPSVQPQPSQQKQSQLSMPNTLLKNPVTQGFSNPVQQPQRPRIYMPDFLGRRGSGSNWSDFLSIANLR